MSEQGSDAWLAERIGHASASRAEDILAKTKTGYAASREDYMYELAIERITNKPSPGPDPNNKDILRGKRLESPARRRFMAATGILIAQVGFIKHPTLAWCGASPDGLAGDVGLEIKCPRAKAHGYTMLNGMPAKHIPQVQFQMWVCGLSGVWFVSYCEDFPDAIALHYELIPRDEKKIAEIAEETTKFLSQVETATRQLQIIMEKRAA